MSHVNSKSILLNIPPQLDISIDNETGVVDEAKFCKAKAFIENLKEKVYLYNYSVVCSPPNRMYFAGGLSSRQKLDTAERFELQNKMIYTSEEININRTILIEELVSEKINKIRESSFTIDMPYRSKPLIFVLNNSFS